MRSLSSIRESPVRRMARGLLALCLLGNIVPAANASSSKGEGSAIITSCNGEASILTSDGRRRGAETHRVLQPSGIGFKTESNTQLFLTFSNGVSLGLDSDSVVQCTEYSQNSFEAINPERGREPSVSNLKLHLETGRIAVASNRLSPLSELRVTLPFGELRLHKGTCLIEYDSTGLHFSAFEGNLTYYYPDSDTREYVSAGKRVRISEQSAARQQVAKVSDISTLLADAERLCLAAQHASQRVVFQPNATPGEPPLPVLVVSPSYFDQPDIRPYRLLD